MHVVMTAPPPAVISFSWSSSVGHGVNDVIHAYPDSQVRKLQRITWSVGPLPGISNVRIQRNGHHDTALIVIDALPARNLSIFLVARLQVLGSGDAVSIVQIKDGME